MRDATTSATTLGVPLAETPGGLAAMSAVGGAEPAAATEAPDNTLDTNMADASSAERTRWTRGSKDGFIVIPPRIFDAVSPGGG